MTDAIVHIFKTRAVADRGGWSVPRETEPYYAAMASGREEYDCICEDLRNLPEAIARTFNHYGIRVVPQNLSDYQVFKKIELGDGHQVQVVHEPLTTTELSDFVSAAITKIRFLNDYYKGEIRMLQKKDRRNKK